MQREKIFLLSLLFTLIIPGLLSSQTTKILAPDWVIKSVSDMTDEYPNLEFISANDGDEMVQKVAECDAIIGWVNSDIIKKGNNLRWIQSPSAGVEGFVRIPGLVQSDITLTNAKIIMGPQIADHAFALLLTLTRNIKQFHNQMTTASWTRDQGLPLLELRGKTMLIIGIGGIGTQVAQRASAFGMNVLAIDPKDIPLTGNVEYVGKPDELHSLLPKADVIVSAVPHTIRSEKMLATPEFKQMKNGVILINVSRGAIIDTEVLLRFLQNEKVAAAGLDVTAPEPLPEGHPLWSMKNVIITPHVAGRSDGLDSRRTQLFRENISRFLERLPLKNVVNKKKGY